MVRTLIPGLFAVLVLLSVAVLVSCGGHSSSIPPESVPNVAGAWEFIAISNDGSDTGVEVALQEGSGLVNGIQQPDGQISASSSQIAFVALSPSNLNITAFGGNCLLVIGANSLGPGTVTSIDAPMQFTFTENGNAFTVTGNLSGDGKSLLNGSYTAQSGNTCADPGGTITGTNVSKISGNYAGQMCPPSASSCGTSQDFTDSVVASATENSSGALTLSLGLTGTDNTNFTLTGPVTGNAFLVQGTFQGQTLVYSGYFEVKGSLPSLYLENVTDSASSNYVGTLGLQ